MFMVRMFNPAHPGVVLREYLGELTVTDAAARLGVTRAALSRILNGSAGISADMALRLEAALGTTAEMWMDMQTKYDLWQVAQKSRPRIKPFPRTAHA
jgi:antitoxin HigA-1